MSAYDVSAGCIPIRMATVKVLLSSGGGSSSTTAAEDDHHHDTQ